MDPQITEAIQYTQRLLAGCPVKEPDPALYNGFGAILLTLWETARRDGYPAARRAYNAMKLADPALAVLDENHRDYYPKDTELDEETIKILAGFEYTEAGQAEAFAHLFAERLRYVPGVGWFVWTGVRWEQDNRRATKQYAFTAARARRWAVQQAQPPDGDSDAVKDALARREKAIKWTLSAESNSKANNVVDIAETHPSMITSYNQLDRDSHLIGAANGLIDLRSGQLLAPDRGRMVTMSTGIPFFADAQAPRWEQYMSEICCGDTELVSYLQRAIGYSLTGDTSEQCFFLCHGTGSNGKTTFLNLLGYLAGEYADNTPFSTFEAGKQSSTGQELVALRGKRLISSSETSEGTRLNEARIKALTGKDPITGRYLFSRTSITFVPDFKIWLAVNHRPVITSGGYGLWRRVRLVPFNARFTDEQKDKHLEEKLISELPGILAWAVRGAMAWFNQGLGEPPAVTEATKAYEADSDILGQFLEACTIQGDHYQVKSSQLYAAYSQWTEENGLYALSTPRFSRTLEERGLIKKKTSPGMVWLGLALLGEEPTYD